MNSSQLKMRLRVFVRLLRPSYWLMTGGLSVLVMITLQRGFPEAYQMTLVFLSATLITSGGFAFNDYCDWQADAIVKPDRPIPSKQISLSQVVVLSAMLFLAGLGTALMINLLCFGIVLADAALLILYSAFLKRKSGLWGNLIMGLLIGTAFLYGEAALLQRVSVASFSFTFMCMGSIGGNVLRDILSLEGDLKTGYPTLPAKHGINPSAKIGAFFFFLTIIASPTPYLVEVVNYTYLIPIAIWDCLLFYSALSLFKKPDVQNVRKHERLVTMSMILLPVSLVVGALI
ncbi:UbiA family prenyltransferase [Candidatus Bathyarchaeota archaeon]|nr:UbiA family prenyltransferase [Candidatus Bathyarchaeota archaeon]